MSDEDAGLAEAIVGWGPDDVMLRFKVEMCEREDAHDWLCCPYAHKGEKAARRDPLTHSHLAVICPDIRRSGRCPRGDSCPYAHSVFELHLHPSRYRTQLCTMGESCKRPVCFFAHSLTELRSPPDSASDSASDMNSTGSNAAAPQGDAAPLRGLSFDLGADGGAAAAAAMRAAVSRPRPGRASLDSAMGAAGLATTSFGALAASGSTGPSRRSLDAGIAARDGAARRPRLPLASLLPAELGFADGGDSPTAAFSHQQDVRAAVALLEQRAAGMGAASAIGRGIGRRGGLDGGSRGSSAAAPIGWGGPVLPGVPLLDAEQQRLLSALLVQQQCEQLAAAQCEEFAAQHREQQIAAARQMEAAQQLEAQLRAARQQQDQHAAAAARRRDELQRRDASLLAAQQAAADQQQERQAAALQALWLQERRTAAAVAAAVEAARQESDALAALQWGLEQLGPGGIPTHGAFGSGPAAMGPPLSPDCITVGGSDLIGTLSNRLSLLQMGQLS